MEGQDGKFVAATRKWEMLAATKVKLSGSKKKKQNKTKQNKKNKKIVNKNTYDISFIKRVTWKFLEVSRCSRAKKPAKTEMYKKIVLHVQCCFFAN